MYLISSRGPSAFNSSPNYTVTWAFILDSPVLVQDSTPRLVFLVFSCPSISHLTSLSTLHLEPAQVPSGNSFPLSLAPLPSHLPPAGFILILRTSIFQTGPLRAVHELHLNSRSSVTTPASAISHGSQNDMAPPNPPQGGFTPEEQEKRKAQEARDNAVRRAMLVSPPLPSSTLVPQASTAARPFEHPARALLLTTLDQDDLGLQRLEELPLQDKGTRYASQPMTGHIRPTMHVAWQGKLPLSRWLRWKG